jgi:signal transduction histidine kinase
MADRNRLNTILVNLLDNALKYSPDGGSVQCVLDRQDGIASVAIADEGLGISPEDLPRLFSRFGRIVTPDNSHIPGTGLGLYLARELARMHGGDIVVASEPGRGSVFTLKMPVAQ